MLTKYHPFNVDQKGHLTIGGMDAPALAKKHQTPLYVYDVDIIRQNCRTFVDAFKKQGVDFQVAYASKAFSSIAMLQVIKQEGLSLDVVSGGELLTAIKADFPSEKIHVHGNNKTREVLKMAVDYGVGCIVLDNFHDIDLLEAVLQETGQTMDVLMRVTPGVQADTHQSIMTGNEDSKFGFDLFNNQADTAFHKLLDHPTIHLKGLHCHIGSQIFSSDPFLMAIERMFQKLAIWQDDFGYVPQVLNLGGGFGIAYTEHDHITPYNELIDKLVDHVKLETAGLDMPLPEIWIEPGRSIVGNAGVTLYTVGSIKEIPGVRTYVSVDGGMTDNLRPSLYGAEYDGVVANKANQVPEHTASIAGKCCESGDMLIHNLEMADVVPGDILAVLATGAYGYSMANHYNRFPKAAVVFVENGEDHVVIRRENYEDVLQNDLSYE